MEDCKWETIKIGRMFKVEFRVLQLSIKSIEERLGKLRSDMTSHAKAACVLCQFMIESFWKKILWNTFWNTFWNTYNIIKLCKVEKKTLCLITIIMNFVSSQKLRKFSNLNLILRVKNSHHFFSFISQVTHCKLYRHAWLTLIKCSPIKFSSQSFSP